MIRAALAGALVMLAGCHTRRDTRAAPMEDLSVPRISDSAPPAPAASGSTELGPIGKTISHGWQLVDDQQNPRYVEARTVLAAIRAAPSRAILVHDETVEECSSMGGSHAFFAIVEAKPGVVHYGGHGATLSAAFEKGQIWVAGVTTLARPESVKNDAWCVPDRIIDGKAIAMVPAKSREEARALLDEIAASR